MTKTKTTVTQNLVLASMCVALSVIMPSVFHLAGPQGGKMFLPLFWGVAVAAFLVPPKYVVLVSVLAPIISHFVSAMPPIPMLYFMLIELVVYGLALGFFSKKTKPVIAVALGLVVSRVAYFLCVLAAAYVFHLPAPFTGFVALVSSIALSLPGIVLQMVVVPIICHTYQKVSNHE